MEDVKQKKVIPLVQKSGTFNYKIIIPKEVEQKIRYACDKIHNVEWSGTLFFTVNGNFEDNNLEILCKDIYIMDIGNSTYTEFDMNPGVVSYMCENSELLDCQLGLIHSHNNMPTFFSGTDTATLREEGTDRNNFVSLIVNNAGTYTAAITRKVKTKCLKEEYSYEFFGSGTYKNTNEVGSKSEIIEYFMLNVVKENVLPEFPELDARFNEIREDKAKVVTKAPKTYFDNFKKPVTTVPAQMPSLFKKEEYMDFEEEEEFLECDDIEESFNKVTLRRILIQLLTGSILLKEDNKFDLRKWISSMPKIYENRFGTGTAGQDEFNYWADVFSDFLITNANDFRLSNLGYSDDAISSICAKNLLKELKKLPQNYYIKGFIEVIDRFI